jgi:hypothetical protein
MRRPAVGFLENTLAVIGCWVVNSQKIHEMLVHESLTFDTISKQILLQLVKNAHQGAHR